jgi:hypothetical protein
MTEKESMVANQAYDIMVIPRSKNTDTRILSIIEHHQEDFIKKLRKLVYSPRLPSVFFTIE